MRELLVDRRMFLKGGVAALTVPFIGGCRTGETVGRSYPGWRPGELDIHFIHTGNGEQTFFLFPDGTTMLLDCGDVQRSPAYVAALPPRPGAERSSGEWVRRYLERVTDRRELDYLMVTHWHSDHVCGIPAVGQSFRFKTFLCHQYGERFGREPKIEKGCRDFVETWLPAAFAEGMRERPFEVGATDGIGLCHDADGRFAGQFEIRNIAANGVVWDGASGRRDCAAEHMRATGKPRSMAENFLSAAFRLRYGSFTCFFGGDVSGEFKAADGTTCDYEGLVGSVVGPVDVCKTNHHAFWDAMKAPFVRAVRPRVFLSSTWSPNQINDRNLPIMTSRALYPGDRTIFHGELPEAKRRDYAGRPFLSDLAPTQGHQVVKVAPGGASYEVFVLTALDESMRVTYHLVGNMI